MLMNLHNNEAGRRVREIFFYYLFRRGCHREDFFLDWLRNYGVGGVFFDWVVWRSRFYGGCVLLCVRACVRACVVLVV